MLIFPCLHCHLTLWPDTALCRDIASGKSTSWAWKKRQRNSHNELAATPDRSFLSICLAPRDSISVFGLRSPKRSPFNQHWPNTWSGPHPVYFLIIIPSDYNTQYNCYYYYSSSSFYYYYLQLTYTEHLLWLSRTGLSTLHTLSTVLLTQALWGECYYYPQQTEEIQFMKRKSWDPSPVLSNYKIILYMVPCRSIYVFF